MIVNVAILALVSFILFILAYRFYSVRIGPLFEMDPNRKTPAHELYDGADYIPTKRSVLFGHHFVIIAGAAPILGPIVALHYGWVAAVLWVILGGIFAGAVHDMGSILTSVRHNGTSLMNVSGNIVSERAKTLYLIFVWLTILLILAVFAFVVSWVFTLSPEAATASFALIGFAIIIGVLLFKTRIPFQPVIVVAMVFIVLSIAIGLYMPVLDFVKIGPVFGQVLDQPAEIWPYWYVVLLIYGIIASILPTWTILSPRGFMAAILLIVTMGLGFIGLFIAHPSVDFPAINVMDVTLGPLFPILFITIACGAISGWHSIVGSSMSSKELDNEIDARSIGYGAMLVESALAILAISSVIAAIYVGSLYISPDNPVSVASASDYMGVGTGMAEKAGFFFTGIGYFLENIGIPFASGWMLGALALATFAITTYDSGFKIGRLVWQELWIKRVPVLANPAVATVFLIIPLLPMVFIGMATSPALPWAMTIWPIFGAANQLMAALALLTVSTYLVSTGKSIKYTGIPLAFMLIMTISALVYMGYKFLLADNILLAVISAVLILLAIIVTYESLSVWRKLRAAG